jgi:hypothetical protein
MSFKELQKSKSKNLERKKESAEFSQAGLRIVQGSQIGATGLESDAWHLFRMHAKSPAKYQKLMDSIKLLETGEYSMNQVALLNGYNIKTIYRLLKRWSAIKHKKGLKDVFCKCGRPLSGHDSPCEYRISYTKCESCGKVKNRLYFISSNKCKLCWTIDLWVEREKVL